jgi:hypothetical protein
MYHTRKNPLRKISHDSEAVETVRAGKIRKLHKAFLRYHDPENWGILREGLQRMGRGDLIGSGDHHLVPRHNLSQAVLNAERGRETPGPDRIAKKFGQNKPRPGAAIIRTTGSGRPLPRTAAGKPRKGPVSIGRGGRKQG